MANEENLMPPWSSVNQPDGRGRPKGRSFKSIIQEIMDLPAAKRIKALGDIQEILGNTEKLTNNEALAIRMLAKALSNPDSKSAERILNHGYGMPKQTTEQINVNVEPQLLFRDKDGKIKDGSKPKPPTDEIPAEPSV